MTTDTITVRFFARFREELGTEQVSIPAQPGLTAGDILASLGKRSGPWAQLRDNPAVMIAINQTMAKPSSQVRGGDEVAFFPPVTGG